MLTTPLVGERFRTARAIFGVTQTELAKEAGLSQALISHIEKGQRQATEDVTRAVANALNMPLEFFEVAPLEVPLDSLRFRKYATASATATNRAKALFAEAFRVSSDLVARVGYHTPSLPVGQGELASDDVISLAGLAREALQLAPDAPVPHVTRALERAGVPIAPIVLPSDSRDEDLSATTRHFGLSYWSAPGDHALIGFFPGAQGDRDRFTLAHELGHLVLHSKRIGAADPEAEANLFAAEFLMPRERAAETLSPDLTLKDYARLKAIWGISIQALVYRAGQVEAIDQDRMTSLFKQINARKWRKAEPVFVKPEEPALLRRLLDRVFSARPRADVERELAFPAVLLRSLVPTASETRPVGGSVVQLRR